MGDARKLERAITNLVSNAVKYSPPDTTVLMTLKTHGSSAVIMIKDEGVGIPQEEIPKLFQPFSRLSHTQDMAAGSGLGLFSAKNIVEAHVGTINAESSPGEGLTVEIRLHLAE